MLVTCSSQLSLINFLRGAKSFDLRMVFAQTGIQEQRFLRDRFLIIRAESFESSDPEMFIVGIMRMSSSPFTLIDLLQA